MHIQYQTRTTYRAIISRSIDHLEPELIVEVNEQGALSMAGEPGHLDEDTARSLVRWLNERYPIPF